MLTASYIGYGIVVVLIAVVLELGLTGIEVLIDIYK